MAKKRHLGQIIHTEGRYLGCEVVHLFTQTFTQTMNVTLLWLFMQHCVVLFQLRTIHYLLLTGGSSMYPGFGGGRMDPGFCEKNNSFKPINK